MRVRLAFAVAAHLEPDILVIDEVLAVGDAEFQKKAIGKMQDISRGEGRTVLFVSHNMAAVKSLCTRVIVLKNGKNAFEGTVGEGIEYYLNEEKSRSLVYINNSKSINKPFVKSVKVITSESNGIHQFNEDLKIEIEVFSAGLLEQPAVSYQILNRDNLPLIHELILNSEQEFAQSKGIYKLISTIKNIKLYQGDYKLNVFFADNFTKININRLTEICSFEIINTSKRPYYWDSDTAVYKEDDTIWKVLKLNDFR